MDEYRILTSLLPEPYQTFQNIDGTPLAGGSVAQYVPGTLSFKTSWQDESQNVANQNPLTLDAAGRCVMYGDGDYRLVINDQFGNLIFDGPTSSTLPESDISAAMLPVTSAATLATAIALLGIPAYVSTAIAGISLLPGPTGPTGPTGPAGPIGPDGPPLTETINIQQFVGTGTWVNPGAGTFVSIELWGAGGSGGQIGGGGGGGYTQVLCLLVDLPSTVAVTVGNGGAAVNSAGFPTSLAGNPGLPTSFGTFLQQQGGGGGYAIFNGNNYVPQQGPSGYLLFANALAVIQASTESANNVAAFDSNGSQYAGLALSGTPGANADGTGLFVSAIGGSGGVIGAPGANRGGGGGANAGAISGPGGAGFVVVTTF